MNEYCRRYDMISSVTMIIGPLFVIAGLVFMVWISKEDSQKVINNAIVDRQIWEPLLREMQVHVKKHEEHMKIMKERQEEILRSQKEILSTITKEKLGSLMAKQLKRYPITREDVVRDAVSTEFRIP